MVTALITKSRPACSDPGKWTLAARHLWHVVHDDLRTTGHGLAISFDQVVALTALLYHEESLQRANRAVILAGSEPKRGLIRSQGV